MFATSALIELICRLHLDMFREPGGHCPGIDPHIELVINSNEFYVKSAALGAGVQQEKFAVVIEKAVLSINKKN